MRETQEWIKFGYPKSEKVAVVVEEIAERFRPKKIYLFTQKFSPAGETLSFKLCVVGDFKDKEAAEKEMYLEIDSEIPFDLVLYTQKEWNQLLEVKTSFARKIFLTGTVVYG